MGTKWKNRVVFILCFLLFSIGISGLFNLLVHGQNYMYKNYYHSPDFQGAFDEFASYVGLFELYSLSIEEAKEALTVSNEEIEEHRYRYGSLEVQIENIKSQYEERIQGAKEEGENETLNNFISERDAKIADITKNFESDEYVREKIIKEKEVQLEELYKELEKHRPVFEGYKQSFTYVLTSPDKSKVFSNEKNERMDSTNFRYITNLTVSRDYAIHYGVYDYHYVELLDSVIPISLGPYEGKVGLSKTLPSSNRYVAAAEEYEIKRIIFYVIVGIGIFALLLSILIAIKSKGIREEIKWLQPIYNKLPLDVRGLLFIVSILAAFVAIAIIIDGFPYVVNRNFYDTVEISICIIVGAFFWGIAFSQAYILASDVKNWVDFKEQWQKAVLFKGYMVLRGMYKDTVETLEEAFYDRSTATQVFLTLAVLFGLGFAGIIVTLHPGFIVVYIILLVAIGYPIVMGITKKMGYFHLIVETTNDLASGRMGNDLQANGKSILSVLAANINQLKQGVQISQNEQAKSERLKTELITNVSHDLRTPLTSIINYTELLKNPNVTLEERSSYIDIIDQKSKRLKVLIDDLFEVSKMASGNMVLTKEKVDLVQLLQQALAEYDTELRGSTVHFRVSKSEVPVYANVDGQKLWRVFDNLIGNILKYSLEQSRAYISVTQQSKEAIIIFKNVSKYELSENSDELFERFKRGDTSRQTEGSGLGLAIAKSIVDMHGGNLTIGVDGDLFKVSISLPIE